MVTVQQEEDTVIFTVEGWHKRWAFRSELRIPCVHLKSARPDSGGPRTGPACGRHLRAGPHHGRHVLPDGLFDHKPTFFDVQHPENTVVVELADEHYARLITEVDDPEAVVALLNGLAAAPK